MNYNLHGKRMNVVETAGNGVVNHETIFVFNQTNNIVTAKYSGGLVQRGFLIGKLDSKNLHFKYAQEHKDGNIAGGESNCEIKMGKDETLQLVEHFDWANRKGKNVFQEIIG